MGQIPKISDERMYHNSIKDAKMKRFFIYGEYEIGFN